MAAPRWSRFAAGCIPDTRPAGRGRSERPRPQVDNAERRCRLSPFSLYTYFSLHCFSAVMMILQAGSIRRWTGCFDFRHDTMIEMMLSFFDAGHGRRRLRAVFAAAKVPRSSAIFI